jgi:hypothetical protein
MLYLDFLQALHERLAPRTYLEIGVAQGHSLALSRCRSIGVDPDFHVTEEIRAPASLIRSTSDEFFARLAADGAQPFDGLPVDLTYIDGLHHFEAALRDYIAAERYSGAGSVIAFDDVLPRDSAEAARTPRPANWTGDVFRVPLALAAHRPDLRLLWVDTEPTGTLLVTGLDPASRALADGLDDIVREYVMPDPQPVPARILDRTGALAPDEVLELELWDELRRARSGLEGSAETQAINERPVISGGRSTPRI